MYGLRFKLSAVFLGMLFLMLVILNTYPVIITQSQIVNAKKNDMQDKVSLLSATLASLPELSADKISPVIEILDLDSANGRFIITDTSAEVIYDSARISYLGAKIAVLPDIVKALSGYDVFRSNYKDGVFYSRAAAPIISSDGLRGAIYYYDKDLTEGAFLRQTQNDVRKMSLATVLLGALGVASFSVVFGKRINGLLNGIRYMREGEYSHVIGMKGKDELSEVAKEFNELSSRLQKTEEVRREFVANASHELRTPLASIKLLADSIIEAKKINVKKLREFLTDISDETDRLTRITEHLLILTRIDSSAAGEFKSVDLKSVVEKTVQNLEILAEQYNVKIYTECSGGCFISADPDGAYQIVSNLLENAIKYNRGDNSHVIIRLYLNEDDVFLHVIDNGVGIPEEDRTRIFERFYRVDKAHSRETGGTGLGLSIVKQWVESFGGSIQVESVLNKGTTFIIRFPGVKKSGASI
ncbi:MAG: ATP-binding protein [Bacillota bacterium]|nr:ATP-binding protein [Bacillota bacterium]